MSEKWLPVVGYEGWYDISDRGAVKRMKEECNTFVGKVLKPIATGLGYRQVVLYKNGIGHRYLVHRLVMATFIGPSPIGKEVNHKDGDKANNHLKNLEYVTRSENVVHAINMGLCHNVRGEAHGRAKLAEEDVHEIRRLLAKGITQASIAAQFNISRGAINDIARGATWSYLKEEEEAEEQS